ncbi:BRO family protein [Thalassospira xiamenensis]|uniref:BRO-N domain-containing protein n=1 Tax=Thalassospira xiamenensis TaxID=220697 RepID=UPI000DEDE43E|nr:BRO family protein [Thalassospira xiamenensis]
MSDIVTFSFENIDFRAVDRYGEFWFLGVDVCKALGISNHRDAIRRLADDEKNTVAIADGIPGNPNRTIINEPGVYRLIFTSRVEGAEKFKRWLAHEVLPAIRKAGHYDAVSSSKEHEGEVTKELAAKSEELRNLELDLYRGWHELNTARADDYAKAVENHNNIVSLQKATADALAKHSSLSDAEISRIINKVHNGEKCPPEFVTFRRRLLSERTKQNV